MRRVLICGATGSIGRQAVSVAIESPEIEVVGVSAGSDHIGLLEVAVATGAPCVHLGVDADAAAGGGDVTWCETISELIDRSEPDVVLNSVVGFAGLEVTLAALSRGLSVALANKESLVAAGPMCMVLAEATGASIIPVDSEHSAMLQCMSASDPQEVESVVLTASGGPFRGRTAADLACVTVAEALAHPTWAMGGKISIDSATLMNKGLELIEAQVLFDLESRDIEIVVHPQSIVHALVRHVDGSMVAHMGWPDMRVPISYALHYPRRAPVVTRRLELVDMPTLAFERPDEETFRCLTLARAAAESGGTAPCILNAANEVAVTAFLAGELRFTDIPRVVEGVLDESDAASLDSFEQVNEVDALARMRAREQATALVHATR